ncbi:hypothetical protein HRbin33_01255 [bacterium HR33]|nr:hypothetical protein HRbin33_01255 [bacterium HR33]
MKARVAAFLGAAAILAAACGETTGITIADLVGTWNATKLEFTNKSNPLQKVDVVPLGARLTIVVEPSGRAISTFSFQDFSDVDTSQIVIRGDTLLVDDRRLLFTLSGNTLTITDNNESFDFNQDGAEEPATLLAVLLRQ